MKKRKILLLCASFVLCVSMLLGISTIFTYATKADDQTAATVLPSKYQNIVSKLKYTTPVKNQNPYGMCWAFSAIACAEIDAVKNHGADRNLDLSEWHLSYFTFNGTRETGDRVSLLGTGDSVGHYNVGGSHELAMLTLANWIGFADESVAPLTLFNLSPTKKLDESIMYDCKYKVKEVIFYETAKENMSAVKKAITEYGAVSLEVNCDSKYYDPNTYSQYCHDTQVAADHTVTVVGWDDDFPKENFGKGKVSPEKNGAFLAKNSWGAAWGDEGYYWISYCDESIENAIAYDVVPADEYDKNYQHDGGICVNMVNVGLSRSIANVFVAENDNETLKAISVSALNNASHTGKYVLNIYVKPSSTNEPSLGAIVHTQEGYLHTGLNSLELTKDIKLMRGDTFAVSISADSNILVDTAAQKPMVNTSVILKNEAITSPNQTFFCENGVWTDYSASTVNPWNASIKALSVYSKKLSPLVVEFPVMNALDYGCSLESATFKSVGAVVDPNTREIISGTWSFDDSSSVPKNNDLIPVTFSPDNTELYSSVSVFICAKINLVMPTVSVSGPAKAFGVGDKVLVTLKNPNAPDISDFGDVKLSYSIDGKAKTALDGDSFVIPDEARGKDIVIYVDYAGKENCYAPYSAQTVISVNRYRVLDIISSLPIHIIAILCISCLMILTVTFQFVGTVIILILFLLASLIVLLCRILGRKKHSPKD